MENNKSYNKRLKFNKNKLKYLKNKSVKMTKIFFGSNLQKIRIGSEDSINLEDTISI